MSRYSDIKRGADLNDQFIKYKDWLDDSAAARSASYAANKAKTQDAEWERELCFVLPYQSTGEVMYLESKRLAPTQSSVTFSKDSANLVIAVVSDFTLGELATGKESIRLPGFKFARFIATERSGTPVERTSRISGKKYKQYQTISASGPFGRTTAANTLGAFRAITYGKASVKTFMAKPGHRVSIIPERG